MTEKRFTFLDGFSLRYTCICDNQKGYRTDGVLKQDEVVDLLNALHEENKSLKASILSLENELRQISKITKNGNKSVEI